MAQVELAHVDKTFPGGARALRDLNLDVADGELLVLVGPSGCGKSTVLRILAGLEEPSAGTIRLGGRVVNDLSPRERNVAMVFQDYALYPHMTVRENLVFPLRMRKLGKDEQARRVAWAAELLGLGELLERLPRELSGGQRQRVAMGRALVREPAVFLLDEPLSNLDAKLRVAVRAEIEQLQRRTGTTMLYVTHDQVEAMTLGDRVAVLRDGVLQQLAPPRALYETPANAFVAGFVGSPAMNLFAARVATDAGRSALVADDVRIALDGAVAKAAREHGPAPLTAGVRPEAIALAAERDADALPARVAHVELLGHETLLHVRAGAALALVVRLPGMLQAARGDAVHLRVAPESIHLFDADGARIAL
ncbi:MAG: sugar ABC transporter ATP-binding protein [Proteobacteria bacterium]|nr:MAG: sugar ABC transporter ATP-binding protein [Pseudomonadota bacterium]